MSAAPVINNLYEAKALLEITRGEKFDELKTFSTIANALAMHEKLMLYGIRYRPNYKIAIAESFLEISSDLFLKAVGSLLIAETISRWTDKKQELLDLITSLRFTAVKEQISDRFIYINATKPLISLI